MSLVRKIGFLNCMSRMFYTNPILSVFKVEFSILSIFGARHFGFTVNIKTLNFKLV